MLSTTTGPKVGTAPTNTWKPLRVGAGGWVHDIDITPDGTMVCQTDTYGAYLWNPGIPAPNGGTGMWTQLMSTSTMPAGDSNLTLLNVQAFNSSLGCYCIRIAPSNTSTFYMATMGAVYKSINKGQTFVATGFTPVSANTMPSNNGTTFSFGRKMEIDPINPNYVLIGLSNSGGLYKTSNGGTSWTLDSNVPTSSTQIVISYDPRSSQQSGGVSQTIYAFSYGTGCYVTTNAGSSWTKISGSGTSTTSLTTCRRMIVDTNGVVYVTDDSGSSTNLWTYSGSTWTNNTFSSINNTGEGAHAVAIDPTVSNCQRVVAITPSGAIIQTITGLTGTWSGADTGGNPNGGNPSGYISNDIPWLAGEFTSGVSVGNILFDVNGTLWMGEGVGVWNATPPKANLPSGAWYWNSQSAGIEQLVANRICSPPSGNPIAVCWDRSIINLPNPKVYPSTYQPYGVFTGPPAGSSIDWCSSNPATVVSAYGGTLAVSSNKGVSWNTSNSIPVTGSGGGCIAASTPSNFVWVQYGGGSPYYTTNGGSSWTSLGSYFNTNFGITVGSGWNAAGVYFSNDQIVCSDRVNANTFYLYNENTFANGGNVYMTTNGGSTWTAQVPTSLPWQGEPGGNPILVSVPGVAGNLFLTNGQGYSGAHPNSNKLWRSTNNGVTWTSVANVLEPWCIGVGATAAGASYPTVIFWGWYNSNPGVWMSTNNCSSFTQIGNYTMYGTYDTPKWLEADNNVAGRCYIGMTGSGFAYYGI